MFVLLVCPDPNESMTIENPNWLSSMFTEPRRAMNFVSWSAFSKATYRPLVNCSHLQWDRTITISIVTCQNRSSAEFVAEQQVGITLIIITHGLSLPNAVQWHSQEQFHR